MDFVEIEGWSNPRAIGLRGSDGRLVFQVKLVLCGTCRTCKRRHQELWKRFISLGVDAKWERDGELVSFPDPKLDTSKEKLDFLSNLLGQRARFMRLVPDKERSG
jgi:hypothetical protein